MVRLISILLACFLSGGCVVKPPSPSTPFPRSGSLEWRSEKWKVSLQRHPYEDFKPTSVYRITYQTAGHTATLNETSAFQDNDGYTNDDQVAANLRILTDPTGEVLLIQETIPNDCGPCDNYLLVRNVTGKLEAKWLQMPTSTKRNAGAPEGENPKIIAITTGNLWLQYDAEKAFKVKIDTLEAVPGPFPPG